MRTIKVVAVVLVAVVALVQSAFCQPIDMKGYVSFSHMKTGAGFAIERINNNRPLGTVSGSLVLQLWACSAPYNGGVLNGFKMAEVGIGQLQGSFYFNNTSVGSTFYNPPRGTYYTVMTLGEWNGSTYVFQDWANFAPLKYARWFRKHSGQVYLY